MGLHIMSRTLHKPLPFRLESLEFRRLHKDETLLADIWDDAPDRVAAVALIGLLSDPQSAIFAYVDPRDQPVAYMIANRRKRPGYVLNGMEIVRVVVKREFRRQGIAARLLGMFADLDAFVQDPPFVIIPEDRDDLIGLMRKARGKATLMRGHFDNLDGYRFTF